jgi:hypothetical protein
VRAWCPSSGGGGGGGRAAGGRGGGGGGGGGVMVVGDDRTSPRVGDLTPVGRLGTGSGAAGQLGVDMDGGGWWLGKEGKTE